jgi:spore germination protein
MIRITPLFLLMGLMAGCGDQRVLETLGFIHTVSLDLSPQKQEGEESTDKLQVTISLPKVNPESKKLTREILTTSANSSKEARIKLSRQTETILVIGQLRNIWIGNTLARNGISPYLDTLLRDPSISPQVKLTIVEGSSAHDLLIKEYPSHPRTGKYIDRLLEKEADAMMIPRSSVYEFNRDYRDDGIDPVATIIKKEDKHITIDGIALFDDDRYKVSIPADKAIVFSLLRRDTKGGEIVIELSEMDYKPGSLMINSIVSKKNVKVYKNDETDSFNIMIHVKIKGSVREYNGDLKLEEISDRKELEKRISEYFINQANEMVQLMQRNNVDSLGIGTQVRNSMPYKKWKSLNWNKVYPKLTITCKTDIKLKDIGKIE